MRRDRKVCSAVEASIQSSLPLAFRRQTTWDPNPLGLRKGVVAIPCILRNLTARFPSPFGCWFLKFPLPKERNPI